MNVLSVDTDLAHPCSRVHILLDVVQDRAVVLQKSAVVLAAAAAYDRGFNFPSEIPAICHSCCSGMRMFFEYGAIGLASQGPA